MKLPNNEKNSDFSPANRFIFTRLSYYTINVNTPKNYKTGESKVLLSVTRGSRNPITLDLASFTEAELLAFRETVLIATEVAQPVCAALDQRAREEQANGDDTDPRCYRALPSILVRARALRKYSDKLLDGRKNVFRGVEINVVQSGGVPEPGSDLDERSKEEQDGGKDNP